MMPGGVSAGQVMHTVVAEPAELLGGGMARRAETLQTTISRGTGAPSTVISSGPSTPNPILFSVIRGNCDPLGA
jgi:hypothetical protein